jgi:hypothetical protein
VLACLVSWRYVVRLDVVNAGCLAVLLCVYACGQARPQRSCWRVLDMGLVDIFSDPLFVMTAAV